MCGEGEYAILNHQLGLEPTGTQNDVTSFNTGGLEVNATERFYFDSRTQEILEHITIPFAIYQYIDKRVVTIALSQGFCSEFGFKKLEDAYHAMDNDMYRATHPDDKTRVADAAYRFAAFDSKRITSCV